MLVGPLRALQVGQDSLVVLGELGRPGWRVKPTVIGRPSAALTGGTPDRTAARGKKAPMVTIARQASG